MPIELDQALVWEHPFGVFGSRTVFTTVAAAPSRIIVQVSCWDDDGSGPSSPTASVTVGGIAATLDAGPILNPSQRCWIFSLYAHTGLALGAAITLTLTHTVQALSINASSWTGTQSTAGYVETSGSGTLTDTTHWLTPTIAVTSPEALLFAFSTTDNHNVSTTSAPTAPAIEIYDYWQTDTQTNTVAYRVVGPGSYAIGGTWSTADAQQVSGIIAYKAAPYVPFRPRRMPLAV